MDTKHENILHEKEKCNYFVPDGRTFGFLWVVDIFIKPERKHDIVEDPDDSSAHVDSALPGFLND